jgi:hypothetical protein
MGWRLVHACLLLDAHFAKINLLFWYLISGHQIPNVQSIRHWLRSMMCKLSSSQSIFLRLSLMRFLLLPLGINCRWGIKGQNHWGMASNQHRGEAPAVETRRCNWAEWQNHHNRPLWAASWSVETGANTRHFMVSRHGEDQDDLYVEEIG